MSAVLFHHGIKGQKWGVRRTKEQLLHDPYSIAAKINNRQLQVDTLSGTVTAKTTKHLLNQVQRLDRPITAKEILDALEKPLYKEPFLRTRPEDQKTTQRFIGKYATVNINDITGDIATAWKTGHKLVKKYGGKVVK